MIERPDEEHWDRVQGEVLDYVDDLELLLARLTELLSQDGGWCNHGVFMDRPYHPRCSHCVLNQARALLD